MKVTKFLSDIMKAVDRQANGGKIANIRYGFYEDAVAIIVDGYYMLFVKKPEFYLDLEKCFPKAQPVDIKRLVRNPEEALPAYDAGIVRAVPSDPKTKARVLTVDNEEIWINESCLKYFDLDNVTFEGRTRKSPVYVYETYPVKTLVGFLLPINHKV